jgi:presequence protease
MTLFKNLGDTYGHYQLKERFVIDELKIVMNVIEHTKSKSTILHLEADDPENLFCLSFQTLPSSSNGAAHILEHTVLCGSAKYPVKDPFFAMQKRSLNTFMNALTGSDFTCYPASSLNKKDFYNLLSVYLDAVFHPKLLENSFNQEGHRLEFAKSDDPSTDLEIKGIVYNEMKGSMASSDSRLWHTMLKELTPDLPYSHNSGGDPKEILTLTYPELRAFFETYYHPSRCLFYFYGNFPLKDHLDFLSQEILDEVAPVPPLPPMGMQQPFAKPKLVHMEIPAPKAEDLTEENVIGFGFLTAPISDQLDVLALTLLDSYLMDTDTSPLKKALIESELCDNVDSYLDPEMSEVPYVIFCRGVDINCHEKLKKVIYDTLNAIADSGISKVDLASSLHQLELSRTEIGGDSQPFGLTLFMRSALAYQHGVSPEKGLIVHALFDILSEKLEDRHFMSRLIKKYLVENTTAVELIAKASSTLLEDESKEEKRYLENVKSKLTLEQKEALVKKAKALNEFQKQLEHQDIECLPKITLSDVDPFIKTYDLKKQAPGLYTYEAFTNGMFYADAIASLQDLTEDELVLAPVLAALITEVGLKEASYEKTLETMHAYTGGISASCGLYIPCDHEDQPTPVLIFKGKALKRHKEPFLELLYKMIYHPRFDELKRLEDLINQLYTSLQNKLPRQAMRYASQRALSAFSKAGYLNNLFYGLPFYEKIKAIKQGGKDAIKILSLQLKNLYEKWLHQAPIELIVVEDEGEALKTLPYIKATFSKLKDFESSPLNLDFIPKELKEAHIIPTAVAFNVKAMKAPTYLHKDAPSLTLASSLMENVFLHSKVREIGGAYGVGASYSTLTGAFYFHSYRDPHISRTFHAFKEAQSAIVEGHFSLKELDEAKICIMQHIDAPLSPIARAITAYSYLKEHRTNERRQLFRTSLLKATMQQIIDSTKTHLNEETHPSFVSFCGLDVYKKEENNLKNINLPLAVIPL